MPTVNLEETVFDFILSSNCASHLDDYSDFRLERSQTPRRLESDSFEDTYHGGD